MAFIKVTGVTYAFVFSTVTLTTAIQLQIGYYSLSVLLCWFVWSITPIFKV